MTPDELAAYLGRIGHDGPARPDLQTLTALHGAHPSAIPFESLDPLLGRGVRIDPASVHAKLVLGKRGGYCFEQNGLFQRALTAIGFRTTALGARVRWNLPEDAPPTPVSHMLLKVDLPEGPFVCDVGFGGQSPTAPLRLEAGTAQETPHGTYRFLETDGGHDLQMRLPDRWATLYRFTLEPRHAADYEVANWFTATHPQSRFTNNLVASRAPPDRRVNLLNRRRTTYWRDGSQTEDELADAQALRGVLAEDFGLQVDAEDAARLWERLPAG
jgi:N-hydroxyarylamine O-acetyltransferase